MAKFQPGWIIFCHARRSDFAVPVFRSPDAAGICQASCRPKTLAEGNFYCPTPTGERCRFERRNRSQASPISASTRYHQPGAGHRVARRQSAGQLQRLRQRVRFRRVVSAGIHGRKEITSNPSASGRPRLYPVRRERIQGDRRADRCFRVALRFHRLGLLAAVLRCRHHPDAVRKGRGDSRGYSYATSFGPVCARQALRCKSFTNASEYMVCTDERAGSPGCRHATNSQRPSRSGNCGKA